MKILHLTLKKKWFDLIASGEKKIEYREMKQYWIKRIIGTIHSHVQFRNGYRKDSPTMIVKIEFADARTGEQLRLLNELPKNGEQLDLNEDFIIIKLGEIVEIKNHTSP